LKPFNTYGEAKKRIQSITMRYVALHENKPKTGCFAEFCGYWESAAVEISVSECDLEKWKRQRVFEVDSVMTKISRTLGLDILRAAKNLHAELKLTCTQPKLKYVASGQADVSIAISTQQPAHDVQLKRAMPERATAKQTLFFGTLVLFLFMLLLSHKKIF
jgi:hypothetical protein